MEYVNSFSKGNKDIFCRNLKNHMGVHDPHQRHNIGFWKGRRETVQLMVGVAELFVSGSRILIFFLFPLQISQCNVDMQNVQIYVGRSMVVLSALLHPCSPIHCQTPL